MSWVGARKGAATLIASRTRLVPWHLGGPSFGGRRYGDSILSEEVSFLQSSWWVCVRMTSPLDILVLREQNGDTTQGEANFAFWGRGLMSEEVVAGIGGAFIGAILTFVSAWWLHRRQEISSLREELRNAIMALLDLSEEAESKSSSLPDERRRDSLLQLINQKRVVYMQAAEALVNKIPKNVSSAEYRVLAREFWDDADFPLAKEYHRRSIKVSRSTVSKAVAYRSLADFYFRPSPAQDINAGRSSYQKAVDLVQGATDAYSMYVRGYTYELWGFGELYNGFEVEGNQKISLARKCYGGLPDDFSLKHDLLKWLDLKVRDSAGHGT